MSELPPKPPASPKSQQPEPREAPTGPTPPPSTPKTTRDPGHKATQYDGQPQPQGADNNPSQLKPRDDTPMFVEEKSSKK